MRRRKLHDLEHENTDRWLLTYSDLITLLLAFFIAMYAMSRIDAKRFGKMADALQGILKGGDKVLRFDDKPEEISKGHGVLHIGDLKMLKQQIDDRFKTVAGGTEIVHTEVTERGLVVHILESALYSAGSAELEPRAMNVLDMIYDKIQGFPNHVRIEGHTDDLPIKSTVYPSNWELSTARATSVVRYFIANHNAPPTKTSALGYGEFRPIKPNTSIENRAANRRVDVVVLTLELSAKEPSAELYSPPLAGQ
jgi:chemotaxis protein MotB